MKYSSYIDEITQNKIYVVPGYQWNTLDRYTIRIFAEKKPEYQGSSRKILRYFPQIDDNKEENIYEVGPREGFRYLKDAKIALEQTLKELGIVING